MAKKHSLEGSSNQRFEVILLILLAASTIFSSWCVYQAGRWTNVSTIERGKIVALRLEVINASNTAHTLTLIDVQTFTDWVRAKSENNDELADFIEKRFRPEFHLAFYAWLSMVDSDAQNSIPTGTPFSLPEYDLAAKREVERLNKEISASIERADGAVEIAEKYVLNTILFATVLFLAGVAPKFGTKATRKAVLILALLIFIVAVVLVWILPVTFTYAEELLSNLIL